MGDNAPLEADVAELNREAQAAVDRCIAARVELDASITNLSDVRSKIAEGSAAAVAFIDAYTNPQTPNLPPVAPEVAAPAPAEEPPVFTTVDTIVLDTTNTSGGESSVSDLLEPDFESEEIADAEDIGSTSPDGGGEF